MNAENDPYDEAAAWWTNCLAHYISNANEALVKRASSELLKLLSKEDFKTYRSTAFDIKHCLETINKLPPSLDVEKRDILKKLEGLKVFRVN